MLTEKAPAKINLTLEVLGKRPDGFHEIRSVFQTIDLCDNLYFDDAGSVAIACDMLGWSPQVSLVSRAVELLRETTGTSKGVSIKVEKKIPLLSGLGGDSSDAAAVLRGLDRLWGLNLPAEKMLALAARLGSDVPFFIRGGMALAEGRGERVTPVPSWPRRWFVLVVPDTGREAGKTGRMYAALRPQHFTDGSIKEKAVAALKRGEFSGELLFNTFENIAFNDSNTRVYVDHLLKLGAHRVHLAGSGPALFTVFEDAGRAKDFYEACYSQGMQAYLAKTL
jgi:4-diphosphocytidyl-2-C-methyl-D-erythritol kinase